MMSVKAKRPTCRICQVNVVNVREGKMSYREVLAGGLEEEEGGRM